MAKAAGCGARRFQGRSGTFALRIFVAILAALTALFAVVLTVEASAGRAAKQTGAAISPGCDRSRPAVAHYGGGIRLKRQPADRPIPCMTLVGRSVEAATIGVTGTGIVMYAPRTNNAAAPPTDVLQGPEFVVRSRDRGASWTALGSGGPTTGGLVPPWMDVDPDTSRVWFVTTLPNLCGARISWSDDNGSRWRTNPKVGCPGMGSERVLEGPPPRGGSRPHGYPHVVYYCGNGTDVANSVLYCYKSLDGGHTFKSAGGFPDPGPPGYCGTEHAARPGAVGPDGLLYFPLDFCGKLGIAISRDEGATWRRLVVANTNIQDLYITSLAVDSSGNIYISWVAGGGTASGVEGRGLPYLVISRDHGRTWSKPIMVAAPGVRQVIHTAIAAADTGHIAIAYLGSTSTNPNANFSGYITESKDVLARRPVFWSAAVNNPARPLYPGSHKETFGDRLFLISDTFGPDGTPWAAFHCAYESACPNERIGVTSRLVRP
jgi:BNR/Asp-box repeat